MSDEEISTQANSFEDGTENFACTPCTYEDSLHAKRREQRALVWYSVALRL